MWFALVATVAIGALIYKLFFGGSKDFWKKYGVRQIDTSPAVSNLQLVLGKKLMTDADDYAVTQMDPSEKVVGFVQMGQPVLIVNDLELIKKVLIKDFDHFVDRRQFFNKSDGSLGHMLTVLEGDEWKGVRASVSPTFTTGKIRRMMEYFNSVGKEWVDEYRNKAKSSKDGSMAVDVMTAVNQYTVEVISTSVFGMKADCIKNPKSKFITMANNIANFSKTRIIKFGLRINFPKISRLLGISIIDEEALAFFEKILDEGLKARMSGASERNDFLQLLVEASKGEVKSAAGGDELNSFEKEAQVSVKEKKQYLTTEVMNAQSVLFFFAGFSTTSNLIAFIIYALAVYQEVQDKLREEVDKIVKEDGSLDYDEIGKAVYMDMVMCEVLRKFPATSRLERVCVKEYKDAETGFVVPKGCLVSVPLNSLHHSKEHYDNPDKFDPEHFAPDKKAARNPYAYMPFGMGPRNCIGMRFAQTEVKAVVAHVVHNFKIEPTPTTPVPMRGSPAGLQLIPPHGLELKLTPINSKK